MRRISPRSSPAALSVLAALGLFAVGCSPAADTGTTTGTGGAASGSGGSTPAGTGGRGTGGATTSTGGAGTGGAGTGGTVGTGGAGTGTGGTVGTGGAGTGGRGTGGAGTGGAGVGGRGTGGAGTGGRGTGGSGTGGAGGASGRFSFFMASQAGLGRLANNANGFGGDLRFGEADGLTGADKICRQLAETSMPGNGKTWRAFLSVTMGPAGTPVNAIDRIGEGPWYDRMGRIVALNKAALLSSTGRPAGADAVILNDLPNEDGIPNHDPGTGIIDNHNVLTGSTTQGTIDGQGTAGLTATCQNWTSSVSSGGRPRCGVSWPRASLINWISVLNEGGCAPGTTPGNGAQSGPSGTVGALGGYGGIYCMALTP